MDCTISITTIGLQEGNMREMTKISDKLPNKDHSNSRGKRKKQKVGAPERPKNQQIHQGKAGILFLDFWFLGPKSRYTPIKDFFMDALF